MLQTRNTQSTCLRSANGLCLGQRGKSCEVYCGKDGCDLERMKNLDETTIAPVTIGGKCDLFGAWWDHTGSPQVLWDGSNSQCALPFPGTDPTCDSLPFGDSHASDLMRVCACTTTTSTMAQLSQAARDSPAVAGSATGDPHIWSLRKAHYTLLQEGIFTAWSFSKAMTSSMISMAPAQNEVNWQLLAAYGGNHFTTQGLMLLDKGSGKTMMTMEIMAEDCTWRVKEEGVWRKAQVELLRSAGATNFQVRQVHGKLNNSKTLRSAIILRMQHGHGGLHGRVSKVAKLVVHCTPQNHLDFKMAMYRKDDIDHVGGELGAAPPKKNNYQFLSKQGLMETEMRTDQQFQAPGTWISLGGRPASAAYLRFKRDDGLGAGAVGFLQSCSDEEARRAHEVCAKHLQERGHPEIFADCVFDLCHGGDEAFAQSAAALISA